MKTQPDIIIGQVHSYDGPECYLDVLERQPQGFYTFRVEAIGPNRGKGVRAKLRAEFIKNAEVAGKTVKGVRFIGHDMIKTHYHDYFERGDVMKWDDLKDADFTAYHHYFIDYPAPVNMTKVHDGEYLGSKMGWRDLRDLCNGGNIRRAILKVTE
jgi:hypothetical protein